MRHIIRGTQPNAATELAMPVVVKADEVRAKKLIIGEGKHRLQISVSDDDKYIGLWMHGQDSTKCLTLFAQDNGQFFVGIHSKQEGKLGGCPIAMSVDENGEPYVQFVSKGETTVLTAKDFRRLPK